MSMTRYGRKKSKKTLRRTLPGVQLVGNPFAHMKRTPAELIIDHGKDYPKTMVQAMIVLNELTPTGVSLFTEAPFHAEDIATLSIPSLRNFFVRGRVMASKEIPSNQGILSARAFHYRIELDFIFNSEQERQAVRDYCTYLKSSFLTSAA